MNADGKIYIIVTDKLPGGTPTPTPTAPNQGQSKEDTGLFAHWARGRLLSTAKSIAIQSVNYSLANIGNFTGDYITQTHINETLGNIRGFAGIGMAALAGFKVAGPMGAAVGAVLGTVNATVSSAFQINAQRVQNSRVNYEIEQLRNRAGMNPLMDGSRGTEN